jgi:hypothetical protein
VSAATVVMTGRQDRATARRRRERMGIRSLSVVENDLQLHDSTADATPSSVA